MYHAVPCCAVLAEAVLRLRCAVLHLGCSEDHERHQALCSGEKWMQGFMARLHVTLFMSSTALDEPHWRSCTLGGRSTRMSKTETEDNLLEQYRC